MIGLQEYHVIPLVGLCHPGVFFNEKACISLVKTVIANETVIMSRLE